MKVQEIRELIKLVDQSNISELTFESDGTKIKLRKPEAGSVVYSAAVPEVKAVEVNPAAPASPTTAPAAKPVEAPKAVEQAPVAAVSVSNAVDLHQITSPMV